MKAETKTRRPDDELSLAWSDHDYAMGAIAGWNAALEYAAQRQGQTQFIDQINRTASEAYRVIARASTL